MRAVDYLDRSSLDICIASDHHERTHMPKLLSIAIVLVCFSSLSATGCEIIFIRDVISFFDKRGAKKGSIGPNEYALPADGRNSELMMLDWTNGCGCLSGDSDFRNGYREIRIKIEGEWEEVYIDFSSVKVIEYKPKLIENSLPRPNTYDARGGTILDLKGIIDNLVFSSFVKPNIVNAFTYPQTREKVWDALVETIAKHQFSISTIDPVSGIIIAESQRDPLGNTMVCPTLFDSNNMVKFNIFVKTIPSGTKVTVNTTFVAIRDKAELFNCCSNGKLEQLIDSEIQALLSAP